MNKPDRYFQRETAAVESTNRWRQFVGRLSLYLTDNDGGTPKEKNILRGLHFVTTGIVVGGLRFVSENPFHLTGAQEGVAGLIILGSGVVAELGRMFTKESTLTPR